MPTTVLGPWDGGLNLVSNRESAVGLADNELAEATNVCFTLDGNIEPRPGFKIVKQAKSLYVDGGVLTILGSMTLSTGVTAILVQKVVANQATIYKFLSVYDNTHAPWGGTSITVIFNPPVGTIFTHAMMLNSGQTTHSGVVLFSNEVGKSYLNPNFDLSGTWNLIPGKSDALVGLPNGIPASDGGMVVKNRLFLWKNSTSKFMWSPPNELLDFSEKINSSATGHGNDIARSQPIDMTHDQDGLTGVEFINNQFYIFKRTKFYTFTYQINPTDDGYLRKVSDEGGALASTTYRGNVLVLSSKGIFRLDGVEPIDLQPKLNLRFEFPLDSNIPAMQDSFITDFNNNILVGIKYSNASPYGGEPTYYIMNGFTGAWSRWDFDYMESSESEPEPSPTIVIPKIASPGSKTYLLQESSSDTQHLVFTNFDKTRIVYSMHKPFVDDSSELRGYHYYLDSEMDDLTGTNGYYIPAVDIKTKANFGASLLRHKKIQRIFVRFYLADIKLPLPNTPPWDVMESPTELWTARVNFDDYRDDYDTTHDPAQRVKVYPMDPNLQFLPPTQEFGLPTPPLLPFITVYQRTYQLPFHQMRATEFTFSLKRKYSKAYYILSNPDSDRPAKEGYYFLLSAVWFDYLDKAGI